MVYGLKIVGPSGLYLIDLDNVQVRTGIDLFYSVKGANCDTACPHSCCKYKPFPN